MSTEATAPAQGAEPAAGEPKSKLANKLILPLVVGVMTVAGGVIGVLVVGPRLNARAAVQAGLEAAPSAKNKGEKGAEEGKEGDKAEKGPMLKLDNLIVNPSGSQGSRFLMVSVAIETTSGDQGEKLRAREPQIRDVIIALLERQTMEGLSLPGIRDTLKSQLSDTISAIAGSKTKLRVFLPQFVIQ